jgi:acetylornithine/LysW-gamma-L-lysine aminotransferase
MTLSASTRPEDFQIWEARHTSGAYPKRPLTIVQGSGSKVYDALGNEFLDLTSGYGVALLGHSHPKVVQAVQSQTERLITCPEIFYNDVRAQLYRKLTEILPPGFGRFFLCNSGAEAIEAAIKLARLQTRRAGVVALMGCFHGRTLGALSATWNPRYREAFQPLVPGFQHVPANDIAAADSAIGEGTAAVLVEVIQGEGGVHPLRGDFLSALRRICQQRGALFIADEIQTGLGRTGRWFAFEQHGLIPDVVCLGKGIASGLPMGIVAWRSELGTFATGSHGSTFGGNPLACAAALATIETLRTQNLAQQAAQTGQDFMREIEARRHPLVHEVRGMGLMIGIELRRRVAPALQSLMQKGVLALPAGSTVLRLLPPLVIERETLMASVETITDALEAAYAG